MRRWGDMPCTIFPERRWAEPPFGIKKKFQWEPESTTRKKCWGIVAAPAGGQVGMWNVAAFWYGSWKLVAESWGFCFVLGLLARVGCANQIARVSA